MDFFSKLDNCIKQNNSFLCVGLDPVVLKMPYSIQIKQDALFQFNKEIIDHTKDFVCAYKPNLAFYLQCGAIDQLLKTIQYIPNSIPIILDAKFSDIENTAKAYASSAFEYFKADALTVNPYLGSDSIIPFLDYQDKAIFLLALTSNRGASDFEKLVCKNDKPVYISVIEKIKDLDKNKNACFVVGADKTSEMKVIRELLPKSWFLIPGIGAQAADLEATIKSSVNDKKNIKIIINSSRSILYASQEKDFAKMAGINAKKLKEQINFFIEKI